jgi:hypothetical protein
LNCGKGGALALHAASKHSVEYEIYRRCFNGGDMLFNDEHTNEIGLNGGVFVYTRVPKAPRKKVKSVKKGKTRKKK